MGDRLGAKARQCVACDYQYVVGLSLTDPQIQAATSVVGKSFACGSEGREFTSPHGHLSFGNAWLLFQIT